MLQFPMGCYCAIEVAEAEAIMSMILEPKGRRTYGMCGTFHFCAAGLPLHLSALTEEGVLAPLVSGWVK
jgi:hypothetical protein